VYTSSDLSYDVYLGADTKDDYVNSLNYLSNEANKQGWNLATCGLRFNYICEAPAAAFPCYPPPSPPNPPPSPPVPPFPPMPPSCESAGAPLGDRGAKPLEPRADSHRAQARVLTV
jgi:hypothetical protein